MSKLAVVAIGGNSLIKDETHKTVADQFAAVRETAVHIAEMIAEDSINFFRHLAVEASQAGFDVCDRYSQLRG